jgi:hypothetical protein
MNWYAYVGNDPMNMVDPTGTAQVCHNVQFAVPPSGPNEAPGFGVKTVCEDRDLSWLDRADAASRRAERQVNDIQRKLTAAVCRAPSASVGLGIDAYAGVGASIGAGFNFDLAKGRFGLGVNAGIGVGFGINAGTQYGASPSGGGVFSANLGVSAGFAALVAPGVVAGTTVSKNLKGTNKGEAGVGVGRAGTPTAFANGQGNVAIMTPSLYNLGC